MKNKLNNIELFERIKKVPIKIYLITLIFFLSPFILEILLANIDLNNIQFFLLIIPTFFWTYYIGLAAGFIGVLLSNILFLGYKWFEIKHLGVDYNVDDLYHILIIIIINFTIPMSVGFLANKLIKQRDIIEKIAITDPLTQLYNRRYLLDKLKSIKMSDKAALIFIDLDDYKEINDSLGHEIGDLVLQEVSKRLCEMVKGENIFRLGGDEFVILVTNDVEYDYINYLANSIKKSIANPFRFKGNVLSISASIGASIYPDHTDSPENLLNTADIAMYTAKSLGKDKVEIFNGSIKKNIK